MSKIFLKKISTCCALRFTLKKVTSLSTRSSSKSRSFCTHADLVGKPLSEFSVVKLSNRSLIKLSGADVYPFLQGLITNDMRCLEHDCTSLYAQLLTIKGRVMCDLILYKDSDENATDVLIEVDSGQTETLMKTLKKYKIRKKVTFEDKSKTLATFAAFGCLKERPILDGEISLYRDPRLRELGWRLISPHSVLPDTDITTNEDMYRIHRYKNGVGEGPFEHLPEKALPLECNLNLLNGVSFEKGCFIGQELTSRSHHTGVIRKRIMPIKLHAGSPVLPYTDVKLCSTDKSVGTIRGVAYGRGIALLRINDVLKPSNTLYTTDSENNNVDIETYRPTWWPDGVGVV